MMPHVKKLSLPPYDRLLDDTNNENFHFERYGLCDLNVLYQASLLCTYTTVIIRSSASLKLLHTLMPSSTAPLMTSRAAQPLRTSPNTKRNLFPSQLHAMGPFGCAFHAGSKGIQGLGHPWILQATSSSYLHSSGGNCSRYRFLRRLNYVTQRQGYYACPGKPVRKTGLLC